MDDDAELIARRRPSRRALTIVVVAVGILFAAANTGIVFLTTWAEDNPLPLIALNSGNRVLLATTNQLDAFTYYTVGSLRLLVSDPLFFLLGYWYGDSAVKWVERRSPSYGELLRTAEGWFGKAAYPLVFIAPNNYICLFAGAAGMKLRGFVITNVLGTFTRLYLIRRFGEAFEAPIDEVLAFFARYRLPLFLASLVGVVGYVLYEYRRGKGDLAAIRDLEHELEEEG
ncbi:MAG: DedA family protein [Acidimicrobiales bacterium]